MSELGNLYKIYYTITQTKEDEENREEFNAIPVKIRNKNGDGSYRFYNEEGETVNIKANHLNGAFLDNKILSQTPSMTAYLITEDKDMFELVTNEVPPKDKEDGLAVLKQQMKRLVEDSLTKFIEQLKRATEGIVVEEPTAIEASEVNVTCSEGCGCSHD